MDMTNESYSTFFSAKHGAEVESVLYRRHSNSTFMLLRDGTIKFIGQVPSYRDKFPHAPPLPAGLRYVSIEEDADGHTVIAEISNGEMIFFDLTDFSRSEDMTITHRGRTALTSAAWMRSHRMIHDSRMSIVSGDGGYWKMSGDRNNCPNWIWYPTKSPVLEIASSKSNNTYGFPIVLLEDGSICPESSSTADFVPEGLKFSRLITTSSPDSTENKYVIGVMECGMGIQLSPHEQPTSTGPHKPLLLHRDQPIILPTPGHKLLGVKHREEWVRGRRSNVLIQDLAAEDGSTVVTYHYAPDCQRHASRQPVGGTSLWNYKKFCSNHANEEWHKLMRDIVAHNPKIRPWVPSSAMRHGSMRALVSMLEM